jgi:ABC-type branched-subunit amino acid transport system substrate-binding protein
MNRRRLDALLLTGVLVLSGCGVLRGDEEGTTTAPGVTSEPCPNAVNREKGCIYLGIISDLTVGPFRALAVPITDAQKAFWKRVNQQGGIGDYEVDATRYIRDNKYNPQTHTQVYQEIKGRVLALAQTLGSPTTAAILPDLKASKVIAAPASWTSAWNFEDVLVESGASYCVEAMNAIDYSMEGPRPPKSVLAVHYAGDYGADAAAGAKYAAQARGLTFDAKETPQGADNQGGAVDAIVRGKPDLVILTTGPTDAGAIIGQAAARGFKGRYFGTGPTWNKGLLASPAAPAIKAQYLLTGPWLPFQSNTPGHNAMRQALPGVDPNDGYTSGWVWSYPLKAALQKAAANKELTRDGLLKAVKQLSSVDYEGMLPSGTGNYAADANGGAVRSSVINQPDASQPTGVKVLRESFAGPTARGFRLSRPCFGTL